MISCDVVIDVSPPDCVPFSRHAVHNSERKDAKWQSDVEDFCCGGLRYEYVATQVKTNRFSSLVAGSRDELPLVLEQSLKELLIGGKSGSTISMVPVLLFSGETGSETRFSFKH